MSVSTRAALVTAIKRAQRVVIGRVLNGVNQTLLWCSMFATASNNSLGVMAGTSTTQGVVPDHTTAGFPTLDGFNGLTGYLASAEFNEELMNGSKIRVSDLLFKSGAHNFNANDTLTSQPSYAARLPGTDYTQVGIWIETVGAFTGIPTWTIGYVNELGASKTTTYTALSALGANVMVRIPLAAGDRGVQKIESVVCVTASAGTFNVLVLRALVPGLRAPSFNQGQPVATLGVDRVGLPILFETSALYVQISTDNSGSILTHEVRFTVARG